MVEELEALMHVSASQHTLKRENREGKYRMAKQKKEEYFDFVDSDKLNYQRFTAIYYCTCNSEAIARLIEDIHDVKHINIKKQLTKIMNEIKGRDIDAEDFAIQYSAGFMVECCKQDDNSRYVRYNTINI